MTLTKDDITSKTYINYFIKQQEKLNNHTIPTFKNIVKINEDWEDKFYKILNQEETDRKDSEDDSWNSPFLDRIILAYLEEVAPSLKIEIANKETDSYIDSYYSNTEFKVHSRFLKNTNYFYYYDLDFEIITYYFKDRTWKDKQAQEIEQSLNEEYEDIKDDLIFKTIHKVKIDNAKISPLLITDNSNYHLYYSGIDIEDWSKFEKTFETIKVHNDDYLDKIIDDLINDDKTETLNHLDGKNHLHLLALQDAYYDEENKHFAKIKDRFLD